jgi:hypothetical protein
VFLKEYGSRVLLSILTAKKDSTGNLISPAEWHGRKPGVKLNQITSPEDVSAALDECTYMGVRAELMTCLETEDV